jgi:hypothetical protein
MVDMNRAFIRKRGGLAAALLTAVLLVSGTARAQDGEAADRLDGDVQKARADVAQAKKDIQKADTELRKTDSLISDEAARAAQAEERQAKDRERREKENAALQARLQEAQGKIDAERNAAARQQNAVDEIKARQKQLAALLAGYCDSTAARIDGGLPWDKESRLDRVRALKKDLQAGTATPDEGFARLSAILKDETKQGDEIAVFNKPLTRKDGEVVNAQILKVGNLWLVYMDEEAKRFGVLERTSKGWEWREDLGFAEKNRVRTALEVKGAKRPPQLVTLDLGVVPTGAEAAKGGNP